MGKAVGVTDTKIVFKLGERRLTLDYRKVPFMAWAELKRVLDFTQKTLVTALDNLDVEAVVALIWLERKQRERKLNLIDVISDYQGDGPNSEEAPEFELIDFVVRGKSMMGAVVVEGENGSKVIEGAKDAEEDPTSGS